MKIAFVGSTPIMVLYALLLSKKNDVTLFEGSNKFGGAWSFAKFRNNSYPEKTNIIVPDNNGEEKFIYKMIKFLKKEFKIKIKLNRKKYKNTTDYKPKKVFDYDLNKLFILLANSNIKIEKTWVKTFSIKDNKVKIKNKNFDKIYLPYFVKIEKAQINEKAYKFPYNIIKNKHIQFITKKKFMNEFYYIENFNNVFDRAQLVKKSMYYFFTGRVRKKYKKSSSNMLLKKSNFNLKKNNFKKINLVSFQHHYRDREQIKKLLYLKKFKEIQIIDTRQFVSSFRKLRLV